MPNFNYCMLVFYHTSLTVYPSHAEFRSDYFSWILCTFLQTYPFSERHVHFLMYFWYISGYDYGRLRLFQSQSRRPRETSWWKITKIQVIGIGHLDWSRLNKSCPGQKAAVKMSWLQGHESQRQVLSRMRRRANGTRNIFSTKIAKS